MQSHSTRNLGVDSKPVLQHCAKRSCACSASSPGASQRSAFPTQVTTLKRQRRGPFDFATREIPREVTVDPIAAFSPPFPRRLILRPFPRLGYFPECHTPIEDTLPLDNRAFDWPGQDEPVQVPWVPLALDTEHIGQTSTQAGDPQTPFYENPDVPWAENDPRLTDLQRPVPLYSTDGFANPAIPAEEFDDGRLRAWLPQGGGYSLRRDPREGEDPDFRERLGRPNWSAAPAAEYVVLPVCDILRYLRGHAEQPFGPEAGQPCQNAPDINRCGLPELLRVGDPERGRYTYLSGINSVGGWLAGRQLELSIGVSIHMQMVDRLRLPPAEAPPGAPAPLGIDGVFVGVGQRDFPVQQIVSAGQNELTAPPTTGFLGVIGAGNYNDVHFIQPDQGEVIADQPSFAQWGRASFVASARTEYYLDYPFAPDYGRVPPVGRGDQAPFAVNRALVEELNRGRWRFRNFEDPNADFPLNDLSAEHFATELALGPPGQKPLCQRFRFHLSISPLSFDAYRLLPARFEEAVLFARMGVEFVDIADNRRRHVFSTKTLKLGNRAPLRGVQPIVGVEDDGLFPMRAGGTNELTVFLGGLSHRAPDRYPPPMVVIDDVHARWTNRLQNTLPLPGQGFDLPRDFNN